MRATRRAIALLAALAGCLGAVAYAAAPQRSASPEVVARATGQTPRKPSLVQHPDALAVSTSARFGFVAGSRRARFQCRLDGRPWRPCRSPVVFTGLGPGSHRFAVRIVGAGGRHSRSAGFRWRVLESQDFSISPRLGALDKLYPGAPPQPLPLTIANPNPAPILVTGLNVAASAGAPGCASAGNLSLTGASVSSEAPLRVPAGGSVALPSPGVQAPTIQLRDLPLNQDACQGASFALAFSGSARG